jgi:signal transduction histidine kinase
MCDSLLKILLIEDNPAEARLLQEVLKGFDLQQFCLVRAKRLGEALNLLREDRFDAILLDLTLPDSVGLDSLKPLMAAAPQVPIVVLTNTNDDRLAIEAVRQGAQDYLVKRRVNVEVLVRSLHYAIERKRVAEHLHAEKRALEAQMQEKTVELAKAKELNQLKAEFVSMFSHDFRNPLTTILASAGLLQDCDRELSHEKKLALFQQIRSASRDLARLLDEMILVGRADSGKLECDAKVLDLEVLCRQLLEELQLSAEGKQIELKFICSKKVGEALWDEGLLRHILINLLGNAIKYSPAGRQVRLELSAEVEKVILRLRDWGIGIPAEDLEKLFDPFHRAMNVGSIPGNGLGLAIVKRCVEAHGGQIVVESKLGLGTMFTVTLPLRTQRLGISYID